MAQSGDNIELGREGLEAYKLRKGSYYEILSSAPQKAVLTLKAPFGGTARKVKIHSRIEVRVVERIEKEPCNCSSCTRRA